MQRYFALIGLFLLPVISVAFVVPNKPQTYVNDYAKVLSTEEVSALETKIRSFEQNTTNEIAVVILGSLDGDTIENVSQEIFTKWGIGKKDKNNGVLLLVSIAERKTRIHTGYGVEGDLTDIGTSYIQQDIIRPAFQAGNYYVGINGAVDKMIEALGGNNIVPTNYSQKPKIDWELVFVIGFILIQWIGAILAKSKSWWGGGILGAIIGLVLLFVFSVVTGVIAIIVLTLLGLLFDYLVSNAYKKAKDSGTNMPWFFGGGGFGGGSSGGGFGGFGGGGSGGGGSSGSW